ncbi:MAG: hypothetical protein HQK49_16585 [Oligoflexia bacterium]|nr:hypothetical protein [Oligoflexia bacterium]
MKNPNTSFNKIDRNKIEKKLRMVAGLFELVHSIKKNQLMKKYPLLSEREINHQVYKLIEKGQR